MPDFADPVLVYDRIEENQRATRRLLGFFLLALLPVASGATVWLMPMLGSVVLMVAWGPEMQAAISELDLAELAALEVGMLLFSLVLVTVGIAGTATYLASRHAARLVLRFARARAVGRDEELDLHRVVENLSIGAGLPKPRIHVIECGAPNAFATGRDRDEASIAVTRGLLDRLDRRELEGVIAHELAHIGNGDTRLNTTLSGLVGTLTLPLTLIAGFFSMHRIFAVFGAMLLMPLLGSLALLAQGLLTGAFGELPPILMWWSLHSLLAPLYLVFVAPWIGRLLRRAVSREREFLADADAVLLTRNPDALADALVKVSAATGTPVRAGPATEHLYFGDPLGLDASWLEGLFRSHPPVEERLEQLQRLGSRVPVSAMAEARRIEVQAAEASPRPAEDPPSPAAPPEPAVPPEPEPEPEAGEPERVQPTLPDAALVMARDAQPGKRFRLREKTAPLYERADGWSRVVKKLTSGSIVTAKAWEDGFLRVASGDGTVGYLGRNPRLAAMGEDEDV